MNTGSGRRNEKGKEGGKGEKESEAGAAITVEVC
ncbi:hypothetical protein PC114_g20449 [Phytophthora cactorum]|nr:hypothetical protein PC114_g20449 [Phytophthora cactorum]